MTVDELKIIISAETADLKKACKEAKEQVEDMGKKSSASMDSFKSTLKNVGKAIATYLSVKAIKDFGSSCVQAYNDSTEAVTKLTEIMQTRTKASDAEIQSVLKQASALQKLGVVEDDTITAGAQQIATFATTSDTVNKLLPAMANLAVQQNGVNVSSENMVGIANLMGKALQGQTGALTRVGISFDEAQEKVMKYGTEQERAAMLAQIITDNVGNMNEAMANTPEGKIAQMNNALGDCKEIIGGAIAPILSDIATKVATFVTDNQPKIEDWTANVLPTLQEKIAAVADAIGIAMGWVTDNWDIVCTVGGVILGVAVALGVLSAAQTAYNIVMSACPITWIILGIVALIAAIALLIVKWDDVSAYISRRWETFKKATTIAFGLIKDKFEDLKQGISDKVESIKNTVAEKFNALKEKIMTPIESAKDKVKEVIEKIKGFFNFDWSLPKLKMPHVTISGEFSLVPPKVPKFSIDWYAKGGVIDSPTLFGYGNGRIGGMGEAGAELIAPLENNTEWLDKIADRLNKSDKAQPANFYFQVDGKTWAKATVDNINALTKMTGKLGLIME